MLAVIQYFIRQPAGQQSNELVKLSSRNNFSRSLSKVLIQLIWNWKKQSPKLRSELESETTFLDL